MAAKAAVHRIASMQARLDRACATLAGAALFSMMLVGGADVVGSNLDLLGLTARPVPSSAEFMASMLVVAVFLGLPAAQANKSHIRITLSRVANPRLDAAFDVLRNGCHAAFYGAIAWYAWPLALRALEVGEFAPGLINFPLWPARFLLGLGATVMTAQCLLDALAIVDPRLRAAS